MPSMLYKGVHLLSEGIVSHTKLMLQGMRAFKAYYGQNFRPWANLGRPVVTVKGLWDVLSKAPPCETVPRAGR